MRSRSLVVPVALALTLLTACGSDSGGDDAPAGGAAAQARAVSVSSCGRPLRVEAPPRRAVTLEQNATEILLALGLADRMAGTAYQTDPVLPEHAAEYESVPRLAAQYPSRETLLEAEPDFVYSTYASAFAPDAGGSRADLAELGVPAYLSRLACEDAGLSPETVSIEHTFAEIGEIARIFGVPERGRQVVGELRDRLRAATQVQAPAGTTLLWHYSGTETPYVAGCCGLPHLVTEQLGARNAFGDVPERWPEGSWESIAERDPDVLVLADLSTRAGDGDSAASKRAFLRRDPVARRLTAVREDRIIVVAGSETDPYLRGVAAAEKVAAGLRRLGLAR